MYSDFKIYYKINLEKTAKAAIYSKWGTRYIEGGDYRIAADDGRQRQKSARLQCLPNICFNQGLGEDISLE